ncbi:hypothetical protein IJ380_00280 [Candidatus Saccharibacteria bacterium]|nr:hypothetical protein [Candidatus Saccharibacteria bacterium]
MTKKKKIEEKKTETKKAEVKKPEAKKTEKVEKPEKVEKKTKKKTGKILGILFAVLVVLGGAGYFGYQYLTRTTKTTETVEMPEDARVFSNFFKEYLADRIQVTNLFEYRFRELSNAEILDELTELKDGLSKVSRGMNGFGEDSEYAEIVEILKNDATIYLRLIRELRGVMTVEFADEADRQLEFIKLTEKSSEELRSGLYLSRAAFGEETSGIGMEGILIFEGTALVEVGGGVMNVFVGDVEENVTALTSGDFSGAVKTIDAKKLFGYANSRLIKIGEGVKNELEIGKIKRISVAFEAGEVEVKRESIFSAGKNTWDFSGENEIKGVLKVEENGMSALLLESESRIRGKN